MLYKTIIRAGNYLFLQHAKTFYVLIEPSKIRKFIRKTAKKYIEAFINELEPNTQYNIQPPHFRKDRLSRYVAEYDIEHRPSPAYNWETFSIEIEITEEQRLIEIYNYFQEIILTQSRTKLPKHVMEQILRELLNAEVEIYT